MRLEHIARREGRLSSFLRGEMEMSTGLMNKRKWGDSIQVNGTPQHTDFPVKPGDRITVNLNEPEPQYPAEDGALTLTEAGREAAEKIYERHTLLTRMLESMGVDHKTAAEDACKMEHHISDASLEAIKRYVDLLK